MNTLKSLIRAASVCLLVVVSVPAIADEVIPEEWYGIWELETASYDCDTNALIFSSTDLDTICEGSVFEDPDPGSVTVDCTTSVDGTTYIAHCEGSEEVFPGCIVNFVFDTTGTRNGDSFTSVTTFSTTATGCIDFPDSCQRTETTGTRISGPPNPCGSTPVVHQAWATVKASYR